MLDLLKVNQQHKLPALGNTPILGLFLGGYPALTNPFPTHVLSQPCFCPTATAEAEVPSAGRRTCSVDGLSDSASRSMIQWMTSIGCIRMFNHFNHLLVHAQDRAP